jgi:citrate lyase subunit beta / citryl-CoA lyase
VTTPIRSVLYLPAANARAIEKARSIPCDALILDLEDAVAPDAKEAAREQAARAVRDGGFAPRVLTVRCNGLDTPWGADDLATIAAAGPDALVLPKITDPADLERHKSRLREARGAEALRLWLMIETPAAILSARDLASDGDVDVFVMGTNDLTLELRAVAVEGRAPLVPHLAAAVLAARAAGIRILDGVFNDLGDTDGFAAECRQGVQLGFDGKTLIHPAQVEACNAAWTPSDDEVDHARKVIDAFATAHAEGRGVATVDGRMIEHLHVEMARRVIAAASPPDPPR